MVFRQFIVLLSLSSISNLTLCFGEPDNSAIEKSSAIIREEAKLLNISAVKLVLTCTATYIDVVAEKYREGFLSGMMYTSLDLLRRKRGIRMSYEKEIRWFNEMTNDLSNESNKFLKMAILVILQALEEFLTTMDAYDESMEFSNDKNITNLQLRALEKIPHSHNKVIRAYNKLSTNSKMELETTFCLRTIYNHFRHNLLVRNAGSEMLTQEYWDKIEISNHTLNFPKLEVIKSMSSRQLTILLSLSSISILSQCFGEPNNSLFEKSLTIIREEAQLLNISAVKLALTCTARYVDVVPEKYREGFLSGMMYTSMDLIRKSYEKEIRWLNETADDLSDESNNFLKMALEEILITMDGYYQSIEVSDGKNITNLQLRALEKIPHSHNKVIRAYNKLSTNSKMELETTFCLRTIYNHFRHNLLVRNAGSEMLTQEYWDKIEISNHTLNFPKLEVISGYV
uniref:Fatty-acid and retinol-binding protein 1 n=1 Tax=Pristionchus pacificus TaxID=54126 RepID=A0A2A6CW99_PRIPA|eukprot:PDM82514.1 hypothetical protein PRIPAC_36907 [Pristionchus pacificus]